jgi:hypothetical protein
LEERCTPAVIPIFSTGVNPRGELVQPGQPERHFELIDAPQYSERNLYIFRNLPYDFVPNGPVSSWIGPAQDAYYAYQPGDYTYRQTFDLTGLDPATAVLNIRFASDNLGRIYLNGEETIEQPPDNFTSLFDLTIDEGFRQGLNTLDIVVHNDYSVTGLRMDISGTADRVNDATAVLDQVVQAAATTPVAGRLTGEPATTYRVDLYNTAGPTPPPASDPGDPVATAVVTTDAQGLADLAVEVPRLLDLGSYVHVRTTDAEGLVSDFSGGRAVEPISDLQVTVVPPPEAAIVGREYPLSLSIHNAGPSRAFDVVVETTIAQGLAIRDIASSTGTTTTVGGLVRLTIPMLAPGVTTRLDLTVLPVEAGDYLVTVQADSRSAEAEPADNGARFLVAAREPAAASDVAVAFLTSTLQGVGRTGVAGLLQGRPGTPYRVDLFAGGAAGVVGSLEVTTDDQGSATWALDLPLPLAPGQVLRARATGPSGVAGGLSAAFPVRSRSDLSLAYSASSVIATAGSDVSIRLHVVNTGPSPSGEVELVATLPDGLDVVAVDGPGGEVSSAGPLVRLTVPALAPGGSTVLTMIVRPSRSGLYAITAAAVGQADDPLPSNNAIQVVLQPPPPSVLPPPTDPPPVDPPPVDPPPVDPPAESMPGPAVVSLRRFGMGRLPTRIVLTFNGPLDPVRAIDLANYQITLPGRDRRLGTADDREIELVSAAYNSVERTVTLVLGRPVGLAETYLVEARGEGAGALSDPVGRPLNSATGREPGISFRTKVRGVGPLPSVVPRRLPSRRR